MGANAASSLRGERVRLRPIEADDRDAFLAVTRSSRELHRPWVWPPTTAARFDAWLRDASGSTRERYGVWSNANDDLLGYVALNEIVHSAFQSGYLGYWAAARHARRGHLREGVAVLVRHVFHRRRFRLHRVEANIQPANEASIALVRSLGFRLEGLSPRYLRIDGQWRDHERWALTVEDWNTSEP